MFALRLVSAVVLLHAALSHPMDDMLKADENFSGTRWVLLAAGSNRYSNYRHQSDILHAYHIAKDHGIPDKNIILMVYDDLAYNSRNPVKGNIINKPNGKNLYPNIEIDYKQGNVNPSVFYSVLQGDSAGVRGKGTGQVIKSGPNDHIFIFTDDHGAPGFFCMPTGGYVYATKFNQVLKNMHTQRKYAKMVVYIEACESGSIFYNKLPSNINVFGMTAANERESSYAYYYDSKRKTYLGDEFSVKWMEDTDSHSLSSETIQQQFIKVRSQTRGSHVKEYGDMSIGKDTLLEYIGTHNGAENSVVDSTEEQKPAPERVDNREVPLMVEFHKLMDAKSQTEKEEIFGTMMEMLEKRLSMVDKVHAIFDKALEESKVDPSKATWEGRHSLVNHECYEPIVEKFHKQCYDVNENDYVLTYMHKFVTLCENGVQNQHIMKAIDTFCIGEKDTGVH